MAKRNTVAISQLARFAGEPEDILKRANAASLRYGTRAHNKLGQAIDPITLAIIIALLVIVWLLVGQ